MSTLKEVLKGFKPEFKSELDNECFKGLAEVFLYVWWVYFGVRSQKRVV